MVKTRLAQRSTDARSISRTVHTRTRKRYAYLTVFTAHDKPASGFSRGVDKFAAAQPERRRQEPSHSKLLHVRVMRSLSLRNLIREGSWISCPATPDALSSEAFSGLAPETDPCRHLHRLVGRLAACPVASAPEFVRTGQLATQTDLKLACLKLEVCRSIRPGAEGLDDRDRV